MATLTDHIDPISFDELRTLSELDGTWLTLAMPTHRAGSNTRQDPIRFGNLAAEAGRQLAGRTNGAQAAESISNWLDEVVRDHEFWRYQSSGLVVFAGEGEQHVFRLPSEVAEGVIVDDSPAVGILLPFIAGNTRFRVLAISADSARLLEGTINTMAELDLGPIPASYHDTFIHHERQYQTQGATNAGGDTKIEDDALTRYFRAVDAGLTERLRNEPPAPLVLASVPENVTRFREVCSQRSLLEHAVPGNHDKTPVHQLHELAWPIVEASRQLPLSKASDRLQEARGRGEALQDIGEIIDAAQAGRVDVLFVDADASQPDVAVEQAIRQVLLTGGEVLAVGGLDGGAAALTRY